MMTWMTVVNRILEERSTASCGPGQWSWDPVLLLARGEVIFLTNNLTVKFWDGPTNSTLGPNQPNSQLDWSTNGEQIIVRERSIGRRYSKEPFRSGHPGPLWSRMQEYRPPLRGGHPQIERTRQGKPAKPQTFPTFLQRNAARPVLTTGACP